MRRLILWFYERLYTDLAWSYNFVSWLAGGGLWQEWTFVAERYLITEPALDLGCGHGHLVARLARQGHHVAGMDRSPQMLQAARKQLRQNGLKVLLIQGMAQALPFRDTTFGTVITTFPGPYVYDPATQKEIVRALQPGGRWIWVDAPFNLRPTMRMLMFALLSSSAQLKSSVFHCSSNGSHTPVRDMACLTSRELKWHPSIEHVSEFAITVQQVPVKTTFIHVAIMEKYRPPD